MSSKVDLIQAFRTGQVPAGTNFEDLINSFHHTGELSARWQLALNATGQGNGQTETVAAFWWVNPTENSPTHLWIIAEVDNGSVDLSLMSNGAAVCEWNNVSGQVREWQSTALVLPGDGVLTLEAVGTSPYRIYSIFQ